MKSSKPRTVFLTCPYGQTGGGVGGIMACLAWPRMDPSGRFRLLRLESRGGGGVMFAPFFLGVAVCRIVAETAAGRLAVVHVNLAERGGVHREAVLLFAAKLVGARVLLHLHAAQIVAEHRSMPSSDRWLLRRMFVSADRVVVLGECGRRWVTETLGAAPRAVTVLRDGVPATMVARIPRQAGEAFRLLFLGNLLQRTGIVDLLHAMTAIQGAPVALTVAGGGPVDTYRQMAEGLGLGDRVRFAGRVGQAEARGLLAASDALVLPAYDEGLSPVLLEAMATGVPVICTPVGAIPEVFEDRRTALFVPPGDRVALASAIAMLRDDPPLQASLSAEGCALYERDFAMEVFASRLTALYAALDRPRPQAVELGRIAEAGDDR